MPGPHPGAIPPAVPRRTVLRAALITGGLAGAAGCSGRDREPPDPEFLLLTEVIADKQQMIDAYRATIQARPKLAARLDPVLADHEAHLAALERHLPPGSPSPTPRPVRARGSAKPVRALARLERRAASSRPEQTTAVSPALAQALASIGASEAGHVRRLS